MIEVLVPKGGTLNQMGRNAGSMSKFITGLAHQGWA